MKSQFVFAVFLSAASCAAAEVHFDVSPVLADGRLVTEGVTHASQENPFTGESTAPLAYNYWAGSMRVFGYELGEEIPYFAADPGINREGNSYISSAGEAVVLAGTGLPLGSRLYFTVVDELQQWNGVSFEPAAAGVSLSLTYGTTISLTGLSGTQSLLIRTFSANDSVHAHLSALVTDTTPAGVYALQSVLQSDNASVADSLPFWVVYNNQESEAVHEAAIGYIEGNYVPEPAGASVMILVGATLLRRRGRVR